MMDSIRSSACFALGALWWEGYSRRARVRAVPARVSGITSTTTTWAGAAELAVDEVGVVNASVAEKGLALLEQADADEDAATEPEPEPEAGKVSDPRLAGSLPSLGRGLPWARWNRLGKPT